MKSLVQLSLKIGPLVVAMAAGTSVHAQDSDRVEQLENRMGAMETKLDALIELMTKDKSSVSNQAGEHSEGSSTQTSQAPGEVTPGVNLDLYSMPRLEKGDTLPASPSGFPAASAVVEGAQPFNLGAFEKIDGLAQYANPTSKTIGQLYSANMFFQESGEYVFQASMAKREKNYTDVINCVTSVIVDGTVVASAYMKAYNFEPVSSSENGAVSLQGGVHNVGLWSICDRVGHSGQLDIEIGLKSPQDRTPKRLDASLLFVE